ncbi:MAG: hypothetical protein AABX54_01440 [Nanoarchaeota archaeon]
MDNIIIPASITLEKGISTRKYKWKSQRKESIYNIPTRRAALRFTCKKFAEKIYKLNLENRQILIKFLDDDNIFIKRIKDKGSSMQAYSGIHPYIQIVINRILPNKMWKYLEKNNKHIFTFPIKVHFNIIEWKDVNLSPEDFIIEIEKEAKSLMSHSLKKRFRIDVISKGRDFDLKLISPNNKEFVIAISSHIAKTKSRSKEKTIQKILMDIAKMLPYLYENKNVNPVIITRPIEFENSWSFTTSKYLDFYHKKFGFRFITTEFKNGWEDNIIEELLKIE